MSAWTAGLQFGIQLGELQTLQIEIVQKFSGGGEQLRATHHLLVTDAAHPATLFRVFTIWLDTATPRMASISARVMG
jgi:hypothetical protein